MTIAYQQDAPRILYQEDGSRNGLVAMVLSGVACTAFLAALCGLVMFVVEGLFRSPAVPGSYEGAHAGTPFWWVGGLLVTLFTSVILLTAQVRFRGKLAIKRYWVTAALLGILCLATSVTLY